MIHIAVCQTNRLFILLERAETKIRFSMANRMFKTKMNIYRHSPRLMRNNCKHLYPPYFSLPTTFIKILLPEAYEGTRPSTNITNQSDPVIGKGGLEHSGVDLDPESDPDPVGSVTFCRIRSRIRINHFGSGSGQPLPGMNLKQNISDKIHNFSTK